MSDGTIRDAERRWRERGDPESAAEYLRALERAGLLPDQVPVAIPTTAPPIVLASTSSGGNATVIGIPGVGNVLVSYHTPVAAMVEGGRTVWSPAAAYSRAIRRHVRDWTNRDLDDIEEVSEAFLVDLLRLVPISEFWPTCDQCFERRQGIKRQADGRDLCAACASPLPASCVDCGAGLGDVPPFNEDGQSSCVSCANARAGYEDGGPGRLRQCEGCKTENADTWYEHDTMPGEWLCQDCHAQAVRVCIAAGCVGEVPSDQGSDYCAACLQTEATAATAEATPPTEPIQVACSYCGVGPGTWCHTRSGHDVSSFHQSRLNLFDERSAG